jgi:hypothetical protein
MIKKVILATLISILTLFAIYKDSSLYIRLDALIAHNFDTEYHLMHKQHYPILEYSHNAMMHEVQQTIKNKILDKFKDNLPFESIEESLLEVKSCHLQPNRVNCDVRLLVHFENSFNKIKLIEEVFKSIPDQSTPKAESIPKKLPLSEDRLLSFLANLPVELLHLKPVVPGKVNYAYAHIIKMALLFFLYLTLMYLILLKRKSNIHSESS